MSASPVLVLWDVVLVPLQGDVDDRQADRLIDEVLRTVSSRGPRGVVLDLSGVAMIDSHLCAAIADLAKAVRLMGAASVVCGLRPEIALTLETMGVGFKNIQTVRTTEEALASLGIGPLATAMGSGPTMNVETIARGGNGS